MFNANGNAYSVLPNALVCQFFFGQLAVSSGRRMDYKALGIGNISKQGENFQTVDKLVCFCLTCP